MHANTKHLLDSAGVKPEDQKAMQWQDEEADSSDDDDDSEEDLALDAEIEDEFDDEAGKIALAQAHASAQKDGHLHETDIRVDPPLLEAGKKSIAEADKQLEEAKADYDVKKKKAEEQELAFHASSRISKAAREERAKQRTDTTFHLKLHARQ